jgi:hypothetical protein
MKMNLSPKSKLERKIAKGKKNHIIYNGVIVWGFTTAFLYTILMSYIENQSIILNTKLYKNLILSIIVFSVGGIFYGLWSWNWMVKNYKKDHQNRDK